MSKTCMSDIGVSKTREGDLGVVSQFPAHETSFLSKEESLCLTCVLIKSTNGLVCKGEKLLCNSEKIV